MKAVLEEIESGYACFIPDNQSNAVYLKKEDLPKNIKIGQLYDISIDDNGNLDKLKELPKEQERRKARLKRKRKRLKNQNK